MQTIIPELEANYIKDSLTFYLRAALITTALVLCLLAGCNREAWADEREVIASVIAAEACGEMAGGMELVAEVIANRAKAWHKTPYQIVTAKNQFFGYTAPNRNRLYLQCASTADRLAQVILEGKTGHKTGGALYFLLEGEKIRSWHGVKTIVYKRHTFYR